MRRIVRAFDLQMLRSVVLLLAASGLAAAEPKSDPDVAFRAEAKQFATASKRQLVGWGTARLDGTSRRYRFAALVATGKQEIAQGLEAVCGTPDHHVACRGAYIIEQAPGKLWVIGFSDNRWGPTTPFHAQNVDPGTEPTFDAADEDQLVHRQMHNHGTEILGMGFRSGKLAMIEIHDSNRQGDDDRVCKSKTSCPELAKFSYQLVDYVHITVAGPFKTAADIHEPAPPDEY